MVLDDFKKLDRVNDTASEFKKDVCFSLNSFESTKRWDMKLLVVKVEHTLLSTFGP